MSAFLGVWNADEDLKAQVQNTVRYPTMKAENESLFLLGSDPGKHTFHSHSETPDSGWVAAGIGISRDKEPVISDQQSWNDHVNRNTFRELNGHFALCRWDRNSVSLYTDPVGLRNIFLSKLGSSILFSTRLDWLLELLPDPEIEWDRFGSTWLGINPFSQNCFYKGVSRLSQGGKAVLTSGGLHIENNPWTPSSDSYTSLEEALSAFSLAGIRSFSNISLGLSGGLDSRVLLSLLAGNLEPEEYSLYTFDIDDHPDSRYAKELNRPLGAEHEFITPALPDVNELLPSLTELTLRSMFNTSLFELQILEGYKGLGQKNYITIDGMSGEIARRRYFRSLEIKAKDAILHKDPSGLFPHLYSSRAGIFNAEVTSMMESGMREDLQMVMDQLPDAASFEIGNWLDLFSIRTRIPEQVGIKQEYIDSQLFHLMPFIQPSVLNTLFSTDLNRRKNALALRSMIKRNAPELTKIPLVKGDDVYPYWMKDLSSLVWAKMKRKVTPVYHSNKQVDLMLSLEETVKDLFHSSEAQQYSCYDHAEVRSLIRRFYDEKEHDLVNTISWMLTFELVRRKLNLS